MQKIKTTAFEISVHAFDYDSAGGDDLGVTSPTYRGNKLSPTNPKTSKPSVNN